MTEQTRQEPAKRPGRWLKLALFTSLAINLAVAGLMAGAFLRGGPDRHGGPGAESYARPYMSALPKEQRREMFRGVREGTGGKVTDRRARRALYAGVLTALHAEPFDPVALKAAAQQQAEAGVTLLQATQTAWIDIVAGMTPEERAAYAQRVEDALKRGPRKK